MLSGSLFSPKVTASRSHIFILSIILFITTGCPETKDNLWLQLALMTKPKAPSPSCTTPNTFFAYTDDSSSGPVPGHLTLVDPANPLNTIEVEPSGTITNNFYGFILGGDYSNSSFNCSHYLYTVYLKGGSFYRINMVKNGAPVPEQISSETAANNICHILAPYQDFGNPDNSVILYRTAGVDTTCSTDDDDINIITVGMSASDAPLTQTGVGYKSLNTATYDGETGAINGFLVKDKTTNNLEKWDRNFTTQATLASGTTSYSELFDDVSHGVKYIELNGNLYRYDTSGTALGSPIFPIATYIDTWVGLNPLIDETHLYFVENNSVYRVPRDGSGAVVKIVDSAAQPTGTLTGINLSDTKLIFHWSNTTVSFEAEEIYSVSKSGGTPSLLESRTQGNSIVLKTSVDWVYITDSDLGSVNSAIIMKEDGTQRTEHTNAAWSGFTVSNSYDPSNFYLYSIILLNNYNVMDIENIFLLTNADQVATKTLTSYDAATFTEIASYGVIPNSADSVLNLETNVLSNHNNTIYYDVGSTGSSEIFFLKITDPNSLLQLTDGSTDSQWIVGFTGCSLGQGGASGLILLFLTIIALNYLTRKLRLISRTQR